MKKIVIFIFLITFCLPVYAEDSINWHDKGLDYFKSNEFELAIDAFSKAMENDTTFHNQYHRGAAYALNNNSKKALYDLKTAEKAFPHFFWLHYYKYIAHVNLKDYEKAKHDCKMMLETKHNLNYAYHGLGFLALRENDYINALVNTVKAVKLVPNAGTYNNLGKIYTLLEEYDLAIKSFDKAISLDNKYSVLYYNKAFVLEKLDNKKLAAENYKTYLDNADNMDDYRTNMNKAKIIKTAQNKIKKLTKNK